MAEPMRRFQQGRTASNLRIGQPDAVGSPAIPNILLQVCGSEHARGRRSRLVEFDRIDFDRSGDILQILAPELPEMNPDLAFDLVARLTRYANAAAEGHVFKPRCHVDAIAENIAFVFDHVADMDAESKFDSLVNPHSGVSANHAALD